MNQRRRQKLRRGIKGHIQRGNHSFNGRKPDMRGLQLTATLAAAREMPDLYFFLTLPPHTRDPEFELIAR